VQLTFLGTSSGVPTRARNVSAIALRLPQRAEMWLFDCGEGTQHQFLRSELRLGQLRRMFITHMHGDHIFGIPGLLASCGLAGNLEQVDIYGPSGLKDYLRDCNRYSETRCSYGVDVHVAQPGLLFEDEDFRVTTGPLKHRIPAQGYRVEEKDKPGRFDLAKAQALGIEPGPIYGQLQAGKVVTLPDGRQINGQDLCGPARPGRKFAYCTDTIFCEGAVELAQGVDVLVHEATFAHQDADQAFKAMHSTSTMAAQVALAAGVKQLILTHFSPRYAPGNALTLDNLLAEARAIFPQTMLAQDFMSYEIPALG
jgi:ribonuclease Z